MNNYEVTGGPSINSAGVEVKMQQWVETTGLKTVGWAMSFREL